MIEWFSIDSDRKEKNGVFGPSNTSSYGGGFGYKDKTNVEDDCKKEKRERERQIEKEGFL